MTTLILASASPFRRMLLHNAGIPFTGQAAKIDERALEAPLAAAGASPRDIAVALAKAKALDVGLSHPQDVVIGSDQTLSLGDQVFHKPETLADAALHLRALSGRTHFLNSAVVLTQGAEILWRHVSTARMTMRPLSDGFIARHLERAGGKALMSVGAYQLEGEGVQLFETIDGDYFTILGLPLLPLLDQLRRIEAIDG